MENVGKNSQLHKAKKEKNDEFYTQYHDIEKEMNAYLEYDANTFRGKTVLLPEILRPKFYPFRLEKAYQYGLRHRGGVEKSLPLTSILMVMG